MAEENKKFDVKVEGSELQLSLDTNKDGEKLLNLNIQLAEAVQELVKKGIKKEDVKLVDFEFGVGGLKLILDTDQDGEKLLELNINIMEALDESGVMK